MEYTYLKTKVKVIAMSELIALQNAYIEAEKNSQEWLMQDMDEVCCRLEKTIVPTSHTASKSRLS